MLTMILKSTKYQYSLRLDLPLKTAYFLSASRYQINPRLPHLRELFARLPKSIVACRSDPRCSRKRACAYALRGRKESATKRTSENAVKPKFGEYPFQKLS